MVGIRTSPGTQEKLAILSTDSQYDLASVPVQRILSTRAQGSRVRRLSDIGRVGARLKKAESYLTF